MTTIILRTYVRDQYWPDPSSTDVLHNRYPRTIAFDGAYYPTASAAFDALRPVGREEGDDALILMLEVLRSKYRQHPDLAATRLGTQGRIEYRADVSPFWGSQRGGQNWQGRLLQVVRAELRAQSRNQRRSVLEDKRGNLPRNPQPAHQWQIRRGAI